MRLKFYILSILLTIAVPSFAQQYLGSSNLATVNETRKAAALVVQSTFSEYDLRFFDRVSYYDLNEERRSDVYIYVRESVDVREKDDLMESIYKAREKMHLYYDSVQDIRHSINALMDDRHPVLPNTDYSPSALGPEMDVETAEGQQNRGAFRELKRLKEKKVFIVRKSKRPIKSLPWVRRLCYNIHLCLQKL